jgi:hypothetical protein
VINLAPYGEDCTGSACGAIVSAWGCSVWSKLLTALRHAASASRASTCSWHAELAIEHKMRRPALFSHDEMTQWVSQAASAILPHDHGPLGRMAPGAWTRSLAVPNCRRFRLFWSEKVAYANARNVHIAVGICHGRGA